MDQYNKAIEINPEGAAFYVNRGLSMKHLGDQFLEQALEDFNKAISLNPKDPKPYFNRGTIYTGKRDFVRAHEDYDEAIRYAKELPEYDDFSTFLHAKGLAYSDEKKFVEAKRCFEEAIQKNPKSTQSIFHLGVVQHKLKELSNALKSFTEVIKRPIEEEKAEDRLVMFI
jgi:tetratricopeptide (TPR) repeat protein